MSTDTTDLHLDDTEVLDTDAAPTSAEGTTDTRDASDKGEPGPVPYQRFKEVNDTARAYGKLGKPEQIEARLAKLDEFEREQQVAHEARQRDEAEAARKANPKQAEVDDLVGESVRRQFPGIEQVAAQQARTDDLALKRHIQHGMEQIPTFLKEHGLPTDKESVEAYETLVESQILKDPALKAGFWDPTKQADTMREGFTRAKARVLNPALQAAGAKTLDDARARAARTIGRAAPTGTARVEPKKFATKHSPGSAGWEAERASYTRQMIMDALDAEDGDGAAL